MIESSTAIRNRTMFAILPMQYKEQSYCFNSNMTIVCFRFSLMLSKEHDGNVMILTYEIEFFVKLGHQNMCAMFKHVPNSTMYIFNDTNHYLVRLNADYNYSIFSSEVGQS